MNLTAAQIAAGFLTLTAVLAAVGAWMRWIRPRWQRARAKWIAAQDAIIGRDEVRDSITNEVKIPALPGIGVRMAHQEAVSERQAQQMELLTDAVAKLADQGEAISDHERRITRLESADAERLLSKVESAAAYRAMESAIRATPDTEGEAVEDD